jgi:hypothetical protein
MPTPTNNEIKTIHVHLKGPSRSMPGGRSVTGHYRLEGDFVVMCTPEGAPVELNGKRFRRKFGTKSGELSEREVAVQMTKEIRRELRQGPHPVAFFSGPIAYPKAY